jgi:hypothetical protein
VTLAIEHLLSYQHNVQSFFLSHADKYSGVVVPLSVATAFKDGTDGFIRALCTHKPNTVYMIDPRSPLMQKPWDRKHTRESHRRMAAVLGRVAVNTLAEGRPLSVADMTDAAVAEMAAACLGFQLEFGKKDNRKLSKYAKLAGVASLGPLSSPRRLLPPYFQFSTTADSWYGRNVALLDGSVTYLNRVDSGLVGELCPVLHVQGFNRALDWSRVAGDLKTRGIRMCFLYPNNFREADAPVAELAEYKAAVLTLADQGLGVRGLHGGYFAAALSKHRMLGFCNGISYGEWRDSGYHRGGQAMTRLYVPKLHRYLQANEVQELLDQFGDYFAEDSDLLASLLSSGGSALAVSPEQANDHFLACRAAEIQFLDDTNIDGVKKSLTDVAATIDGRMSRLPAGSRDAIARYKDTLTRWVSSL